MARQYLIDMRKQRNESQQDVATGIGISRQYYALIEDGARQKRMDIALAALLAGHFGVPVSTIVENETVSQITRDTEDDTFARGQNAALDA